MSVGLLLFGTQLFIAGLIAELIVDRGPDDLEPYCVAEETPDTRPARRPSRMSTVADPGRDLRRSVYLL